VYDINIIILVLVSLFMVWHKKVINLSNKSLYENLSFLRMFCGFNFDHNRNVSSKIISSGSNPSSVEIDIGDFFRFYHNENVGIAFGVPDDGITINSWYKKGNLEFFLVDNISINHESVVLDAFCSIYGKMPEGYIPKG
jgi:lipoprotein signal peptidase